MEGFRECHISDSCRRYLLTWNARFPKFVGFILRICQLEPLQSVCKGEKTLGIIFKVDQIFFCQLSQVATARGVPLVRGATSIHANLCSQQLKVEYYSSSSSPMVFKGCFLPLSHEKGCLLVPQCYGCIHTKSDAATIPNRVT